MEDFIFDDDVDEVGAEVEAHCPKCKADTTHVVISKYEDEIRRVQCNPCGDVHSFRKPRGDEAEEPEAPAKPSKKVKAKPTYEQVMAKQKKPPRAYAIGEYFKEPEVISHPKFGVGFVSENIGDDKIEVSFQNEKRVLIHNRKNLSLPFLRPVAPAASKAPGKSKGKAAAAPAAPVVAPTPAPAKAETKPSAAARPASKKPAATSKPTAKPTAPVAAPPPKASAARPAAKPAGKAKPKAAPAAAAKKVKSPARAAAKKPPKAKPVKKIKKSR